MQTNSTRYQSLVEAIANHNSDECLLWPFCLDPDGYPRVWYKDKTVKAARLVFFLTHEHWPTPLSRHTCDTPACINPRHIIEGTYVDNVADTIARGRFPVMHGESNACAKLTEESVKIIRAEYRRGDPKFSQSALARRFGINRRTVGHILERKRWAHIA